jgi:hypothetical protein
LGAEHAGQPGAQHFGQPGAGHAGGAPSTSTKGLLIAGGVIAAVIAAVAAVFLLRPDPLQQTGAQQSPTTITNPTPGAATADGPWFRGTYNLAMTYPGGSHTSAVTVTSECPRCDATVGPLIYRWIGTGWQNTEETRCSPSITTLTPTDVVNGIVQQMTGYSGPHCPGSSAEVFLTFSRIGD